MPTINELISGLPEEEKIAIIVETREILNEHCECRYLHIKNYVSPSEADKEIVLREAYIRIKGNTSLIKPF